MVKTTDFLVIGGGIIGISLAIQIKQRYADSTVTIIEKEPNVGAHASGRNSGVLHAGFYYTADSLKARFTRDGNKMLTEYCQQRGLRINKCGKLVVIADESEFDGFAELERRGKNNGVEIKTITDKEAREIEPRIKTIDKALWSPTTSSIDPGEVVTEMVADARQSGIRIETGTAYVKGKNSTITTSQGDMHAGYVVNAAGLYADKLARDFGFSRDYRILPFKGLYLYADEGKQSVHTNIYPVPDLNNPFLGVHYTIAVDGKTKIGPTAIPALWREHYQGLENFNFAEFLEVMLRESKLFLLNEFDFRKLAIGELSKYHRPTMAQLASRLVTGVDARNYRKWGKPGIRAQLINIKTNKLEMDFKFEGDSKSFHVLNAVSPAFTCSMPFSQYLVDHIDTLIS